MDLMYLVEIMNPKTHLVSVRVSGERAKYDKLCFFLPSWSPGSYLMREYARNIRAIKVLAQNGEFLSFVQKTKSVWEIDFKGSELKEDCTSFSIEYEVYCHELTVRTSHIDESHAFMHGPSYLIGIQGQEIKPKIEFRFTPLWSKIHTGLKDISFHRAKFLYTAENYDELIDAPVEIGCHESDGFMAVGKEHHLVWYGEVYPHQQQLKSDIKKIVETVASHFSDVPYESYTFITHLKKGLYGGLEHLNSTALQFDGRKFDHRADYVFWLALVAHEYFHTWNVKRIRPVELGPFDYLHESYTELHWLTEGLTSFMDELFVLRSGLCTLKEYLELQTKNLQKYFSIPGKKFHSLEQSSFNAWVKLYRPDENSHNSSISYYLKGGLVFSTLHFELKQQGKDIRDLLTLLWQRYKNNPALGVSRDEVLDMIEDLAGKNVRDQFELRISTTEDIDFETYYKNIGLEFKWDHCVDLVYLGVDFSYQGDRAMLAKVHLDGPAYKAGLNAGDEILAINKVRACKADCEKLHKIVKPDRPYSFLISRLGTILTLEVMFGKPPRKLSKIEVVDEAKALAHLKI